MKENRIEINRELCTGCGLCVTTCPTGTITLKEGKAVVTEEESILCGHCVAVCPQEAVRVTAIDEEMSRYKTFTANKKWLPPGEFNTAGLVQLMASRRSCRSFTERPVDRALLEDLVKIGTTAPSGTNSQAWTFTTMPTRGAVTFLAEQIAAYYEKLNSTAEKTMLRLILKLLGKGELDVYFHGYYRRVKEALEQWRNSGKDNLFHGSTAAIVVGSKPGASCPAEDALLATQNILLAAHSIGLSTCLIGFAVAAMKKDRTIQQAAGIPQEEEIHAVIAIGYSDEVYQQTAGRKKATLRYSER